MRSIIIIALVVSFRIQASDFFKQYQELKELVPYVNLGNLPTPIHRCYGLERFLQHSNIFVKRDDLSGSKGLYGGNKVRKLEFLLADAVKKGTKKVITFGGAGTNHGVATACYAQQLGLQAFLMLNFQPNSSVVRQNLLLNYYFGAKFAFFIDPEERKKSLDQLLESSTDYYFIPAGGSVPLGILGYVAAAFELKEQIKKGEISEPNVIYVPVGSGGTVAGLLLGCLLADIKTHIIAVAVAPEKTAYGFEFILKKLFLKTNQLLNSLSSRIPLIPFPDERLTINKEFVGTEYGEWLSIGKDATRTMKKEEGIVLEGTYSAKALAALVADCKSGVRKKDEVILFWDTYCGLDFSLLTANMNYTELPKEVHYYFEEAQCEDV